MPFHRGALCSVWVVPRKVTLGRAISDECECLQRAFLLFAFFLFARKKGWR